MLSFIRNTPLSVLLLIMTLTFQLILRFHVSGATDPIIETSTFPSNQGLTFSLDFPDGSSCSSAGDFNKDGFEDIIIAMPKTTIDNKSSCGRVYLIYGSSTGFPTSNLNSIQPSQGFWVIGSNQGAQVGSSVSGLGDINNDGFDDIIIGAYGTGRAYVIFGNVNTGNIDLATTDISTTDKGIVISGPTQLGYQVGSAGDFNKDGINDFMVSTPLASSNQGVVYVIFGKSGIPLTINLNTGLNPLDGFKITGSPSSKFGQSLSLAGDVNNDGISDIMIGSDLAQCSGSPDTCGVVVIIYGNATSIIDLQVGSIPLNRGFQIQGTTSVPIGAKYSISSAGDLNNDDIDDIAIGAPNYSNAGLTNIGTVYIIYGKDKEFSENIDLSQTFSGFQIKGEPQTEWKFGNSVSSADINGDGLSDLLVGCAIADYQSLLGAGIVYVFFGNKKGLSNIDLADQGESLPQLLKIVGDLNTDNLGLVVRPLNQDSVNNIIIQGGSKTYVVYGSECGSMVCGSSPLSPICYASMGCLCGSLTKKFQENICVSSCSPGYYDNIDICKSCSSPCATCVSSSITCQSCITGYYADHSNCLTCPSGCEMCSSSSQCQSCLVGFEPQGTLCRCPQGTYLSGSTCATCPITCSSCTSSSECQSCTGGLVLQGTSCQCPEGFYLSGSTCQANDATINSDIVGLGEIKTINSITDVTDKVDSVSLTAASAIAPHDPGSVTASMLAKMLQYIRYLNISYSQRLELTFKFHNSTYGPFGVGPKMPLNLLLEAPFYPIPYRFLKFHVHSNFLVNFWDNFIFISIVSGILLLLVIIEFSVTKIKQKSAPPILKLVRVTAQNFFLMQFYNVFGDILLFLIIDLRTADLSTAKAEAALSILFSIIFLCVGCIVLGIHFYILIKFNTMRRNRAQNSKTEEFSKKCEGADVLFKHFKDNAFISQSFLLFYVIRNCLFNLVIALLYDIPILQASLIFAMTVLVLIYLFFQRPFKTIVNLVQHIVCEIIFLIVNACVLIMAQLDFSRADSYKSRDNLSEVIIYTNLIFSFVPQTFLAIKVAVALFDWYKKSQQKSLRAKINPKDDVGNRLHKKLQNSITSQSQQYHNSFMNESSVELNMLQNSFNTNINPNDSPILKPKKPNDSPIQRRQLLENNNNLQWQKQEFQETMSPSRIRGSNQNQLRGQSNITDSINSSILEQSNIANSFFVNNRARERWVRKKTNKL